MSYDNACKYLAERFPADFTRWLLGIEATRIRVLKTELDVEPIRADSVVGARHHKYIGYTKSLIMPCPYLPIEFYI